MAEIKRTKTATETETETTTVTAPETTSDTTPETANKETIHKLTSNYITDCLYVEMLEYGERQGYIMMNFTDKNARTKLVDDIFAKYRREAFFMEKLFVPVSYFGDAELIHTVTAGDAWFVKGEYCLSNTMTTSVDEFARGFGLV